MSEEEIDQYHQTFRELEKGFSARPDHARQETEPTLIQLPTELDFRQMTDERLVREAAAAEQRAAEIKDWLERRKREAWKERMKKVLATTALLATVKSGGFIDMAADPFSDAGGVASSAIERAQVQVPDEVDGIAFKDYPEAFQKEIIAGQVKEAEVYNHAADTVVSLFAKIDAEGPDSIVAEVQHEREQHPELYVSAEVADKAREAIEQAATNEAAIAALGTLMKQYDIEVGFYADTAFSDREGELKQALTAYVDVFSVLPKDFVALAELQRVTVSRESVSDQQGAGAEAGTYMPNENAINIVVESKLLSGAAYIESVLERDDLSYETFVAHELGHALDAHLAVHSELKQEEVLDGEGVDAGKFFGQIGSRLINRPGKMSYYGRTSSGENTAELLSGILSDRSNGLALPDEWRRFGSGANKDMIELLAKLEVVRPGIAKVLVANRAR